ncbi:MAG: hypothetical protein JOZ17_08005, partial [Acetobacteraceae bacterium]|nr:hypothetical protein [Acetobacteraceae bacterium]
MRSVPSCSWNEWNSLRASCNSTSAAGPISRSAPTTGLEPRLVSARVSQLPPLREVIARHGLGARKSLGQHFLLDGNLTDRIVRQAGDLGGRHVLEIGPGPGGLTRALL